ncbi:MAG: outer membrane beta-barrel protein [Myxococcota bacterium]
MRDRMRLRRLAGLTALLALALAAPAFAQDDEDEDAGIYSENGLYLSASALYAFATDKDGLESEEEWRLNSAFGPPTSSDADDSWGVSGRLGYRFHPRIAAEVQADWIDGFEIESKLSTMDPNRETDIGMLALTANAKGYLLTERFQPYLLAGAGWGRSFTDRPPRGATQREDGAVFKMGGGIDIYGSPDVALTLEAAYLLPTGEIDDMNYVSLSAGLTLRFYPLD